MKIELVSVPNAGNYILQSLPAREVGGFEPVTACPGCTRADGWKVLAKLGGSRDEPALSLRVCAGCGHVTYDRLPSRDWLARYYDGEWDSRRRERGAADIQLKPHNASPWAMAPHLADLHLPHSARVLDFGCGFGDGLYALQHRGYRELFGVEVGSQRVEVASRYFPGRIRHGSVEAAQALAASDGPFDLITANHVAEHLRDPDEILGALVGLLAPAGLLVVSVPAPQSESPVHLPMYLSHLHHYSRWSLSRMMQRAGLRTWRWNRSSIQLAVAGSRGELTGAEHYEPVEDTVDPGFVESMAAFVTAPWRAGSAGGEVMLNFFHPWSGPKCSGGFKLLAGASQRWYGGPVAWMLPLIERGERSGIDSHNLARRSLLRASRLVFGDQAPSGGDLVRYRNAGGGGDAPWLVAAAGAVPVFGK